MPITPALHLKMILFVIGLCILILIMGKVSINNGTIERQSKILGFLLFGVWFVYVIYYFTPEMFSWKASLPLQVCDMIALSASFALIFKLKIGRALLYFSAIALTTQAVITPTGNQDPNSFRFWLYWVLHAGIIAFFFYDLIIKKYQPSLRDFVLVLAVDIVYVMIVLPINITFGWNYGSLGDSLHDGETLLDMLGPWPQRIFVILGLAMAAQGLMLLFWLGSELINSRSWSKIKQ